MKIKTFLYFVFLGSIIPFKMLHAQPWMTSPDLKKSTDKNLNFYDVQRAFNTWWEENKSEKNETGKKKKMDGNNISAGNILWNQEYTLTAILNYHLFIHK